MKARYELMKAFLINLSDDLSILAGKKSGPPDVTWRDVAKTAIVNAQCLDQLKAARLGNHEPFIMFPSRAACLKEGDDE